MTKQEAMEKVSKILALANDRAATPAEKDTALGMANKLAEKYGLKILKNKAASDKISPEEFLKQRKNNLTHWYDFTPKSAYSKILLAMVDLMKAAGFTCMAVREGKKVVCISYQAGWNDVNKELEKVYKELCKNCDAVKKYQKEFNKTGKSGSELTDEWLAIMQNASRGYYDECEKNHVLGIYNFGRYIIGRLIQVKEGM